MRIKVAHETRYGYAEPARGILQHLRLTPRDHDGQHVIRWQIEPSAQGRLKGEVDEMGNMVHVFQADEPVSELTIRVEGEVETSDTAGLIHDAGERVPEMYFLRETDLTAPDDAIRDFAVSASAAGRDRLGMLHGLLTGLNKAIRFDVNPTNAGTTAQEAFRLGRGVCQDLTHIFLAAARHLDIPSRYVSGYFHRADGVVEQEAGHAWAESSVPGLGWVGFDPANGICTTEAHIRVAVGLDYHGAAPIRGTRRGGGSESLDVRVEVRPAARRQTQS